MTTQSQPTARTRPPWREPMVWLVAAIPAAAVVASIALLVSAVRSSGTDDAVADPVRRTAQVQQADLSADARAQAQGLTAIVRRQGELLEVLPVSGDLGTRDTLVLWLRHPSQARLDQRVTLHAAKHGWRGSIQADFAHDWNLQLTDARGQWRLQGRWPRGHLASHLRPAVDG